MNKTLQRVLLFVIGLPLLLGVIIGLPHHRHLAWNMVVMLITFTGAWEIGGLVGLARKRERILTACLSALFPLTAYFEIIEIVSNRSVHALFFFSTALLLFKSIFVGDPNNIETIIKKVTGSVFVLVYPGYFLMFVIRISGLSQATYLIILLLLLIFANDTFAYLLGTLFGKGSRQIFTVSPNKSITGFVGGTCAAMGLGLLYSLYIMPPPFSDQPVIMAVLCLLITMTANIGDLVESALKRSAQVKDSGTLIPGRGGVLDSIDSILFSAPLFYYTVYFIATHMAV